MLLAMAWRNLWRHGRRTMITAGAMAISVGFVMALLTFMDGMYREMGGVMIDQTIGHLQVAHPDYAESRTLYDTVPAGQSKVDAIAGLPTTRAVSARMYGFVLLGSDTDTAGSQLVGVLPQRELGLVPHEDRLKQGRWLAPDGDHEVVLGAGLADTLEVGLGASVVAVTQAADGSLGNELFEVVGIASSGSAALDRTGAWVNLPDLQGLLVLPDQVHEITVLTTFDDSRAADEDISAAAEAVATAVGGRAALTPDDPDRPQAEDGEIVVRPWWLVDPTVAGMLATSDASAWVTLFIVFAVAGLGVLNTMLMSVFERTRELGVMKALGTRPGKVVQLVLWESMLLGVLATVGGLVIGGLMAWFLVTQGVDMTANGEQMTTGGVLFAERIHGVVRADRIIVTVVCLLGVALLAALWPAIRAARLVPVDAMRQD